MSFFIFNETERTIALRYIKSRRVEGFISVSAWFSLVGIVLGVATLIVVMSVMNGFRTELINKIVGFNAHITVDPYDYKIETNKLNQNLKSISQEMILSNRGEAIIIKNNISKGILLRGYENKDFSKLKIFNNDQFLGNNKLLSKNFAILFFRRRKMKWRASSETHFPKV